MYSVQYHKVIKHLLCLRMCSGLILCLFPTASIADLKNQPVTYRTPSNSVSVWEGKKSQNFTRMIQYNGMDLSSKS